MQPHDDFKKPFVDRTANPSLASQSSQRRWSLATLRAIRPIPQHHSRAYAEEWNRSYGDIADLRVNPADFPVEVPERPAEEIEENDRWLRGLSRGEQQRPNPRFSGR
jgi:hypothetical protein